MTPRNALPPMAALLIAFGVSWAIHVPVYVGLGILQKILELRERAAPETAQPVELEFVDAEDEAEPPPEPAVPPEPEPARDEADRPPAARAEARPEPAPPPEPEPEAPAPEPVVAAAPPPPQPPPPENLTSVEHRSRDPNVEPPPDAQHLAEENSRVEEETQARIRNPHLDDREPSAAPSEEAAAEPLEEGDADDTESAELRDAEGSDARDPTTEELRDPPRVRPPRPSTSPTPAVAEAARGDARAGGSEEAAAPREAAGGGAQTRGGGAPEMTTVVVEDANGRFTVRVPRAPPGVGPGVEGGPAIAGRGQGTEGEGRAAGRAGRGRRTARGGTAGGRGAPNLRLSWSDFATIYGEDELRRERELALAQRQSRMRGRNRREHWERFRAAIENYDVRVRPGTQTALNTRADPFARYIAAMHRRIHTRFALGFLTRVPDGVDETFRGDSNMHTNLEVGIDAQGRVEHVSVVSTSGNTLFDLGAFEAVMGAQPFPEPPPNIQSPDGLVYVHWAFFRNERQCGTFNARPFILARAPARREDRAPTPAEPRPATTPEE